MTPGRQSYASIGVLSARVGANLHFCGRYAWKLARRSRYSYRVDGASAAQGPLLPPSFETQSVTVETVSLMACQ